MNTLYLNSLAEIQRLCNKVDISLLRFAKELEQVPHPSENFTIKTDGTYYLINDNGTKTLYKLKT